jgi:hypothetical protein
MRLLYWKALSWTNPPKSQSPGVNVYIAALAKGAITDKDGYFSVSLPEDDYTISFSAVGYKTQIREVDLLSNSKITVEMEEEVRQIDEITVEEKPLMRM